MLETVERPPATRKRVRSAYEPFAAIFNPRKREETRAPERLREHYVVERRLADRVRAAKGPVERRAIFATMYDELFAQVPDHPRIAAKGASSASRERDLDWSVAQLRPYLFDGCTFLEVGAGDCALAARVAERAGRVYAVDISRQAQGAMPANLEVVITDGRTIDVPAGSVDVAFSDQLMEHLHPDDALEQLRNIHRALKPGGAYMCVTPNRIYGPSDISAFFDDEARGFHLKEYTLGEIREIFAEAGFPTVHVYVGARGFFMRCPSLFVRTLERVLGALSPGLRRKVADMKVFRALLGLRVAGIKG